jgi:hypothetical protein
VEGLLAVHLFVNRNELAMKETAKIEAVTGRLVEEITSEMIEASVLRLFDYDPRFANEEDVVEKIFRAMLAAKRASTQ